MRRQRGFTILEAMISLLLVGIALIGAVLVTINGATYVKSTTHRIIAQGITQGEIGKMRVLGYENVLAMAGESSVEVVIDEGDPSKSGDQLEGEMIQSIVPIDMDGNGSTDILRLEVTVRWDRFGRTHEQRSFSFLTRRTF